MPVGEVGGGYEENFYLIQPNGRPLFSPEYLGRYGASTTPFLDMLQGGALSMVVETGDFPAGEIRGTLTAAAAPSPVPLPAPAALLGVALAALFMARRRPRTTEGASGWRYW